MDGTLVIETLYYPDEIREAPSEIETDGVKVTAAEMKMAEALIDLLAADFKPEEYKDEYREALQQVIDAKLEGVEVEVPEVARPAKVTDLMTALKASVAAAKKQRGGAEEEEEEERPARRRKKAAAAG
jgi:DNA end-binding protein Ku